MSWAAPVACFIFPSTSVFTSPVARPNPCSTRPPTFLPGASESILIHRHDFCSLCITSVVEQPIVDLVRRTVQVCEERVPGKCVMGDYRGSAHAFGRLS